MPNHVRNFIRIDGSPEQVKTILTAIQDDQAGIGSMDFNKLLPMPESLNVESGSRTDKALQLYRNFTIDSIAISLVFLDDPESPEKQRQIDELCKRYDELTKDDPELLKLGEQYSKNIEKYGAPTWYEWCNKNWGTKWNAYDCAPYTPGSSEISFNTAWSSVPKLLTLLSQRFPTVKFEYAWADEDVGHNVGNRTYLAGKVVEENLPVPESVEAYEMAAEIRMEALSDYGLQLSADGTTYEYRDQEEEQGWEP